MISNIIDALRLPFQSDKDLRRALYDILGFYPHNISYYRQALMHKSIGRRNAKGRPLNNERLEFLGDAILDAVVGHIVYRHFEGKREGFLTNTRSKLVSRNTLGQLAKEMGLSQLVLSAGHSTSHNSYVEGNAFEALVGAIYLDRGYDACMCFMEKRILTKLINIDKVAYKEVNFKSKLLEWSQKNRVRMQFKELSQTKGDQMSPLFVTQVMLEGVEGCKGQGYSKKESHQQAAKETLQRLRREPQFIDAVFEAKGNRTKMEENPVENVPNIEQSTAKDFIIHEEPDAKPAQPTAEPEQTATDAAQPTAEPEQTAAKRRKPTRKSGRGRKQTTPATADAEADDFSLDDITAREKSREEIIAEAEAQAFAD